MRTVEDIKADLEKCDKASECEVTEYYRCDECEIKKYCGDDAYHETIVELLYAITKNIPFSDLSTLCDAWRNGRCVVLSEKAVEHIERCGNRICIADELELSEAFQDCSKGCCKCVCDGLNNLAREELESKEGAINGNDAI